MYGKALPVIVILVKCHGCRLIQRRADPRFPCGGMDVINTPAGESCDSRYFCTTRPPIEGPITTGGVGRLSATTLMSSTKSATEQARSGLSVGLLPWPRRLTARARYPLSAKKLRKFSSQHHAACQAPWTNSRGTAWDSLTHPLSITSSMSHTVSRALWALCKPPWVKVLLGATAKYHACEANL